MEEPSVLDYIKSKINPRKYKQVEIPDVGIVPVEKTDLVDSDISQNQLFSFNLPWRIYFSLILALIAQRRLDAGTDQVTLSIIFYVLSLGFLIWSIIIKEIRITEDKRNESWLETTDYAKNLLYVSIPLIIVSFFTFSGNKFSVLNILLWIFIIYLLFKSFWIRSKDNTGQARFNLKNIKLFPISFRLSKWNVIVALVFLVAVFFRFYQLAQVPGEMFSDHAEKLLDVADVLNGETSIFFPRNTGREAFQMYLTAIVSIIFNTKISFLSLKIGTALAGLFSLPYVYLLGKEIGNKYVALIAMFLAGIAYWPNVISRVGLRFTLYPFFLAPALYYFIHGLRQSKRNYLILSGIFLGLGLHGYSPSRFVPILLVIGILLYLLHTKSKIDRYKSINAFFILVLISFVVFLPLFRYWTQNPEMFSYRAFTRMGTSERAYPGAVAIIFLKNLWAAITMFFWKNGNIWVHSVTNRPALDVISAVFFFYGVVLLFIRYLKSKNWIDLFILLSIPILMMPSILSLAFPDENPCLNRTAGALVPVFVVTAFAFESFVRSLFNSSGTKFAKFIATISIVFLISWTTIQNYDLVFNQYKNQFINNAWNTSDIGRVIRGFSESIGNKDSAYVVPYPYWVDTRLVGINAGYPDKDYALWAEEFQETLDVEGPKLFIIKPEDNEALTELESLYPNGVLQMFDVGIDGRDFYTFLVP